MKISSAVLTVVVVAGVFALFAASASASQFEIFQGGVVYVQEASGVDEQNDISVTEAAGTETFKEDTVNLTLVTANSACTQADPKTVTCPTSSVTGRVMFLGQQDDAVDVNVSTPEVTQIAGGDGDDTITAGGGSTELFGDGPNASGGDFYGYDPTGDGNDVITGRGGNDSIDGGAGADQMSGGGNVDFVKYSWPPSTSRTNGVTVDLDGTIGDDGEACPGPSCEGDTVGDDIEGLVGAAGDDSLTGNALPLNGFNGGDGNDTFSGGPGSTADGVDSFFGGDGIDTVSYSGRTNGVALSANGIGNSDDGEACPGLSCEGDAVNDDIENLVGGSAADVLMGTADDNVLTGGPGGDQLDGGSAGSDTASYASSPGPTGVTVNLATDSASGTGTDADGDTLVTDTIDSVTGSAFADTLTGDAGANVLEGLAGKDRLDGGDGPDELGGGGGVDTTTYAGRSPTEPVQVTVNGVGDDGGDLDTHADNVETENVTGGQGNDSLTGSGGANVLIGGIGADKLFGLQGNDKLKAKDHVRDKRIDCGRGSGDSAARDSNLDPAPISC